MHRFLKITLFVFAFALAYATPAIKRNGLMEPGHTFTEKIVFYDLAGNTVPIKIQQYGDKDNFVFINLHDDEITSVEAAKRILAEYGGLLIELENNGQRNIRFKLDKHHYTVDPNTIFSREGIKKSLEQFERTSVKAVNEVEMLGKRILQLIPADATCIIALHNNTPDSYSVIEYAPGNKRSVDSKKTSISNDQDPDDFFLTTDNRLYEGLVKKGYNIILQDNKNCTDDGSLSVYCGKRKIRYINCETEHGKPAQYYEMLKDLVTLFDNDE
jgi:hypothetical protein